MALNPTRGHLCIVSPLNLPAVDRSTGSVVLKMNGAARCMRSLLDGSLRCHNAAYFICWRPGAAPCVPQQPAEGRAPGAREQTSVYLQSPPEEGTAKNSTCAVVWPKSTFHLLVLRLFVTSGEQQLLVVRVCRR